MRARHQPGTEREANALEAIPVALVRRFLQARHEPRYPLSLRCEALDAYDAARAAGATAAAIIEVLGLSSTVLITRWRRDRLRLMTLLEPIVDRA